MRRRLLLLSLIAAVAFVARLTLLQQTAEPPGTDGYYYVVQVEHLLATFHPRVADASWVLRLLAFLAAPFHDVVVGIKVASSALAAAAVPAAFLMGEAIGPEEEAGSWALALWAAASPTLTHLSGDFPKNVGMVAPAFLGLALVLRQPFSRARFGFGVAALLAAALAHRVGASLLLLALLGGIAGAFLKDRRVPRRAVLASAVACLLFLAATAWLPNLLHPADADRTAGQVLLQPGWPPPIPYFALRSTSVPEKAELLLPWVAFALGLLAFAVRPERRALLGALLLPLAGCLLPLWRTDTLDVGYRLALMAPVLAAPLALAAIPPLPRLSVMACRGAFLLVLAASPFLARTGFDPQRHPPYGRFRALLAEIPRPLPQLLITPPAMSFLYTHLTGLDAMSWAPEPGVDQTRTGRVVYGIRAGEWSELLPGQAEPLGLDHDYAYVREDYWEDFVAAARDRHDDELLSRVNDPRNPSQVRPAYLLRNQVREPETDPRAR